MIEEETAENVQGLSRVGEAASVVSKEPGGVVFSLGDGLPEKDERSGDGDVLRRFPFIPDFLVSFPSALRHGACEPWIIAQQLVKL
jgi:hypothetical protein